MTPPHLVVITDFPPWPRPLFGAQLRVARLTEELCRGFRVTMVCAEWSESLRGEAEIPAGVYRLIRGSRVEQLPDFRWGGLVDTLDGLLPNKVPAHIRSLVPLSLLGELQELRATDPPDAVWAVRSWMGELARRAGLKNIVVDVDDFEHVAWRKDILHRGWYKRALVHRFACRALERYERRLDERFPGIALTKESDRSLLSRRPGSTCTIGVVANSVSIPEAVSPVPRSKILVFVGMLGWGPNIEAISWFAQQVLPLIRRRDSEVVFHVAGRGPIPGSLEGVLTLPGVKVSESPAEIAPIYAEARAAVTPVRLGDGTKIKVLEAMAMGRPVVTTTDAAKGHSIVHGEHVLIAESPEDFAEACLRVLIDDATATRLALSGRDFVLRHGSWRRSGREAVALVHQVIEGAQRP